MKEGNDGSYATLLEKKHEGCREMMIIASKIPF
jgi:hypothetical protein